MDVIVDEFDFDVDVTAFAKIVDAQLDVEANRRMGVVHSCLVSSSVSERERKEVIIFNILPWLPWLM